jgi:hypothetical protein
MRSPHSTHARCWPVRSSRSRTPLQGINLSPSGIGLLGITPGPALSALRRRGVRIGFRSPQALPGSATKVAKDFSRICGGKRKLRQFLSHSGVGRIVALFTTRPAPPAWCARPTTNHRPPCAQCPLLDSMAGSAPGRMRRAPSAQWTRSSSRIGKPDPKPADDRAIFIFSLRDVCRRSGTDAGEFFKAG